MAPAAPQLLARRDVQSRLLRLYAAAGHTDKVLELELQRFAEHDQLLEDLSQVEQMAQRFQAAGQEARFSQWAKQKLDEAKSPVARANLAWQQGNHEAAITNIARAAATLKHWGLQPWKDRFGRLGREPLRALLLAIVETNPADAIARLELLDLEDRLEGAEAIAALEQLLATDAASAFPRGKGARNRTHFKHYLDLAYRLIRLYEKNHRLDKLRALGLRIASGEKPFEKFDQNYYPSFGQNSVEEFGNACLALAVVYADDEAYQTQLAAALKDSRWAGARAQLERKVGQASRLSQSAPNAVVAPGASKKPHASQSSGTGGMSVRPWANLPEGVQVFASCETILCAERDEQHVYAGHPWGLAVYDFNGTPVTRILLGSEARTIITEPRAVWVGTPAGLFRITNVTQASRPSRTPQVAAPAPGHSEKSDTPRTAGIGETPVLRWSIAHAPLGHVTALALDGNQLWIGLRGGVLMLDRHSLALRTFSPEELGREQPGECSRIVPDGDYVWTDGSGGVLRYDRTADAWSAPAHPGPRDPPRLIGVVDGQVWADVYLDDALRHRPARIDRPTLRLSVVHLGGSVSRDQRMINAGLTYAGKDQGRLVFAADWQRFVFEEKVGQIRRLPEPDAGGIPTISDPLTEGLLLPKGTLVRAGMRDQPHGGLYFISPKPALALAQTPSSKNGEDQSLLTSATNVMAVRRVSATAWPDALRGHIRASVWPDAWPPEAVWAVLFDDAHDRAWLCTGSGLAVLPKGGDTLQHFGDTEGVNYGPILDGVKLAGKLYFACGWEDARGGLIVFDPPTQVFTTFFRSDGMDSDKVIGLSVQDGQFELRYGVEYLRYGNVGERRYRHCRPGRYDPATGRFASGGEPELLVRREAEKRAAQASLGSLPLLGGSMTRRYERHGQTWRCGARGLVIVFGNEQPALTLATLDVQRLPSPWQVLREQAAAVSIPRAIPLDRLKELVVHTNRYVRANRHDPLRQFAQAIFQHAGPDLLPVLHEALRSSDRVIRSNAARACGAIGDIASGPHLLQALDMESGLARASIVWALGKLKARDALPQLIELYADARNAEHNRRASGGFLAQQAVAAHRTQYTALRNLDAIASDWEELKVAALRPPADPRRDEELLSPELVLEAVRQIGPAFAQPFYRALAGAEASSDRAEGAIGLAAAATAANREQSLAILRNLRGDSQPHVRVCATVSLLLLGEASLTAPLRERLRIADNSERGMILQQLARLSAVQLNPFRPELQFIAANDREPLYLRERAGVLLQALSSR